MVRANTPRIVQVAVIHSVPRLFWSFAMTLYCSMGTALISKPIEVSANDLTISSASGELEHILEAIFVLAPGLRRRMSTAPISLKALTQRKPVLDERILSDPSEVSLSVDEIFWRAEDRSWLGLYELVTSTRIFPVSLRSWATTKSQSATDGMAKMRISARTRASSKSVSGTSVSWKKPSFCRFGLVTSRACDEDEVLLME
mmetsp:Transcript_20880/g.38315  ORF Transcript_20880/g.38315 Transcript_20880/m.38315 type:complete len:201 (+) Transcript_20880:851-1453(+)